MQYFFLIIAINMMYPFVCKCFVAVTQESSGHTNLATSARVQELEKHLTGARKRLAEAHSQCQEYKQEIEQLNERVKELTDNVIKIS
jgi:septal ring factor EnvC (AmiA/AmiB activator)